MYIKSKPDGNNIGDAGLQNLSKGNWKKMQTLSVSTRWGLGRDWMKLGGFCYLIRGNWMSLKELFMGN
jgi:hypothetical protein